MQNRSEKKTRVAIVILDKTDFETKTVTRDRERHYIIIKAPSQQEDITIVNIYVPKMGAPKCIKQLITKEVIDSNTIMVGDINTLLISMGRSSKQKMNKESVALNDTLDKMDLRDIFRKLHHRTAEYTFLSSALGTFSRIDHMLGHKTSLNEFKKFEVIPCIFSEHNSMKLEINQ